MREFRAGAKEENVSLRETWVFLDTELVHLDAKVHLRWSVISVGDGCTRTHTCLYIKSRLWAELSKGFCMKKRVFLVYLHTDYLVSSPATRTHTHPASVPV